MDALKTMSLKDLKQYCRDNNLKGFSKYTKKESIIEFIRSKNIVVEDKEDIIKKLQEELKKKADRVKELELKESFEDPEVDSDLSDEHCDGEYEDVSSDEIHFGERYNGEEKMKKKLEKIKKDYEEKLIVERDIMYHKQFKEQLRLDREKWIKMNSDRKKELDVVITVLKKMGKDVKLINNDVNKYIIERYGHFLDKNGGKDKQVILFHGTDEKNIKPIMENGFSLTMNKAHGAVHGEGIYFTDDINFAMIYPKDNNMIRNIIVCQVRVDNKIIGRTAVNAFPKIPGSNKYYDTGVDNLYKPKQFIKKTVDDINILGHIQINNNVKSNITNITNLYAGIKIINNTSIILSVYWNKYMHLNFTQINISTCVSMGDISPNSLNNIKTHIGDQFIIGYYDKDKHFNICRVINVKAVREVFTID